MGFCHGIENYSRHLTGRAPGEPPPTLLDYLPRDSLVVIDESHITVPQLQGMYRGDRSRKQTLVDYGFRLPSALDNRPLCFEEFEARVHQMIYVSATPGPYEMEQGRRPGGGADRPPHRPDGPRDHRQAGHQPGGRSPGGDPGPGGSGANGCWSPPSPSAWPKTSPSTTRTWASRCATSTPTSPPWSAWRSSGTCAWGSSTSWWASTCCGKGLDLPEVSLVAILDADKEGFLRSGALPDPDLRPGRPKRPGRGAVLRRQSDPVHGRGHGGNRSAAALVQAAYNQEHGITPETIQSRIKDVLSSVYEADYVTVPLAAEEQAAYLVEDVPAQIRKLEERDADRRQKTGLRAGRGPAGPDPGPGGGQLKYA